MSVAVELPALGESVVEGTVSRWLVQEGDAVEVDQPLVEVTTDKVDAEVPAPAAGVVEKILVPEGETVEVGTQLALIDTSGKAAGKERPAAPAAEREEPASEGPAAPAPERGEAPPPPEQRAADEEGGGRPTPVARRIAEEANLDLGEISGTGAAGRITKSDVLRHRERAQRGSASEAVAEAEPRRGSASPAPREAAPQRAREPRPPYATYHLQEGDRVVPLTPQRRLIAEHMVYSKHTSPHVGTVAEVDLSRVVSLRNRKKREFQEVHGIPLTFLPFVVHATARALREFPRLNASLIEDSIVEKRDLHIGVAVETEKGLVVPVVRHADRLSLAGLAAAVEDLSTRARSKKLSADELRGGTFTVSNPGRQGNLYGFAIINQPQVGILRMGEIVKRPVVRSIDGEDAIVIRPTMHLALSYDHRVVDGAPANGFLYRIGELLEAAEFEV
jgi:2-oxoglutarate dehydrogenase E2 component (dihydrolipoamide succinyltransferase)